MSQFLERNGFDFEGLGGDDDDFPKVPDLKPFPKTPSEPGGGGGRGSLEHAKALRPSAVVGRTPRPSVSLGFDPLPILRRLATSAGLSGPLVVGAIGQRGAWVGGVRGAKHALPQGVVAQVRGQMAQTELDAYLQAIREAILRSQPNYCAGAAKAYLWLNGVKGCRADPMGYQSTHCGPEARFKGGQRYVPGYEGDDTMLINWCQEVPWRPCPRYQGMTDAQYKACSTKPANW